VAVWLFWGINWPIWKVALRDTGPVEFIALRSIVTSALLIGLMALLNRSLVPRPLGPLALIGILQGVGMNGLSVIAVNDSGATKATIFAYTMPFWTVLFARAILHEDIKLRHWIAIAAGVVGVGIFAAAGGSRVSEFGAVLATCGAICWALGTVVWKWTIARYDVDPMVMVTWQNVFSVVPLGIGALLLHEAPMHWTPFFTFAFVYNVLITAVIAWFVWYWVLQRLSAVTAGMSSLAIPVVSILTSFIVLGEHPLPMQWAGIVAILISLFVVTYSGADKPNEATPPSGRTSTAPSTADRRTSLSSGRSTRSQ
jgi:drug/metabolite transporter (DMT)-like permease